MSALSSSIPAIPEHQTTLVNSLRLRAITADDMPHLRTMYADSRAKEMQLFPFTPEQSAQFLQMQFNAQHQHYQTHYPDATYDLIVLDDEAIGRLYVERGQQEILIIDILILATHCQRGIGSYLLSKLIDEAKAAQKCLTAHVELDNPARRLYQRLGFIEVEQHGPYLLIVKDPTPTSDDQHHQTQHTTTELERS
ncbi:GNAT family N-acetyltransferase [Undibacterium flavidum]|uniref:GNAT family N-acetyltransferase n=1 Tax=Undibacterium flavidum TaxID=2762297 RepID=A0ABR6YBP9_9BURK|nr:GNAT family N-acetyltransferase [Undibacterium flavidum]MBC3873667.1 GNAT family N-acetyltransferase [Undibacterium flavidum]